MALRGIESHAFPNTFLQYSENPKIPGGTYPCIPEGQDSFVFADESESLKDVLDKLNKEEVQYGFIVTEGNKLLGAVSEKDLTDSLSTSKTSLQEIILNDPPMLNRVYVDTPIDELVPMSAMSDCPVTVIDEEDNLLGIVTRGALLLSLAESQQAQLIDPSSSK